MYRKGVCGSFVLMVAGELQGDPEVEKSFSHHADVYAWLRDCPEQIERELIVGGGFHRAKKSFN
jgi:hypothetical protein